MSYQYFNVVNKKTLLLNGPKKWEAYTGIKRIQGSQFYGVNNLFNDANCPNTLELSNTAGGYTYYHDDNNNPDWTTPACYSGVNPIPTGGIFNGVGGTNDCISNPPQTPAQLKSRMSSNVANAEAQRLMIDAGNTDSLLDIITDGDTTIIKAALAGASPYLSPEVLKAATNQSALTAKALAGILLSNANLPDDVIEEVDDLPSNKKDSVHDIIDTALHGISVFDTIVANVTFYLADRDKALNELINAFSDDDSTGHGLDSVIEALNNETEPKWQCRLACTYIVNYEWTKADSVLNILDDDTVYSSFCKLQRLLQDNRLLSSVNIDTLILQLDSIAQDTLHYGYSQAQSAIFALTWEIKPLNFPEFQSSSPRKAANGKPEEKKFDASQNFLYCYPNPVTEELGISISIPDHTSLAEIKLTDAFGRLMYRQKLANDVSQTALKIHVDTFATGVYFVSLFCDGVNCSTVRVLKSD